MNGSRIKRAFNYASTELVRPINESIAVQGDPFPEVADEPEFYGYNPDLPAVHPDDDVFSLLREIRDTLKKPDPNSDYWMLYARQIPPTTTGEISIVDNNNFRYLYVANAPRILNVYMGIGKALYLGQIPIGKSLQASLPFVTDGVTLEWIDNGGGATQSVVIVLSSKELKVDIK